MHTLWAPQPHGSNAAGLRPHCCFFQSHCPHRLFFPHKIGTLLGAGERRRGKAGSILQALQVLSGTAVLDISPLSSTFFLGCLCCGQARPHISRSWMQNSSRCERVSLSKVSQGWLPPWCRFPSSHSPNLPLPRCQEHSQLRPASFMAGDLPRHLPGHQPPPVLTLVPKTGMRVGEAAGSGLPPRLQAGSGLWEREGSGLGWSWERQRAGMEREGSGQSRSWERGRSRQGSGREQHGAGSPSSRQ